MFNKKINYLENPLIFIDISFRYIFGIPPLILVLLPVASSDCDINGKDGGAYQNVLMVNIDDLVCVYRKVEENVENSHIPTLPLYNFLCN
ncbi:hypothetical protein FD755_016457 [Muntiacus reevesi]|uniref:Interleukin-7 n=1 Tax=Muntiacus reevesi TaxID=9886 RepID=A0A5N3XC16_MUNRE|nr:hypothetical protein FD755_016457 [Muntiacus reevesi]